jgi:hypothetical protein
MKATPALVADSLLFTTPTPLHRIHGHGEEGRACRDSTMSAWFAASLKEEDIDRRTWGKSRQIYSVIIQGPAN